MTISNRTAPEVADCCMDSNSHDAMHAIDDKRDMTNGLEEVEVNESPWTHVTSPNS